MTFLQVFRVAVLALLRNKLRSTLTMLGIVIGSAAVIAMVAIGEGAKEQVKQSFASMGADLLIIMPGTTTRGGAFGGFGSMPTLSWDDLKAIQTTVPAVKHAAAVLRTNAQVASQDQNWSTSVSGTSPDYFTIRTWRIATGSLFSPADIEGHSKVALLGQTVVDKLFGAGINPVGETIRIKNIPFLVMGVLERKGQSPNGQDYDDAIFVPQTTYLSKIQGGLQKYIPGVVFVGCREGMTSRAQQSITGLLRERHHIAEDSDDDFSIRNLAEMASAQEEGTQTLSLLLASIAAVSLLVGGIGIMNIMLVSVTERTREIGLRMAVGARPRDILTQFLVEASTLSVAGGGIGVALGIATSYYLASQFHWPHRLPFEVIGIALVFSGLVGVGFGLYPAHKASKLDPIDALRYE